MRYCGIDVPAVQNFAECVLERLRKMQALQELQQTATQLNNKRVESTLSVHDVDAVLYALYMVCIYIYIYMCVCTNPLPRAHHITPNLYFSDS